MNYLTLRRILYLVAGLAFLAIGLKMLQSIDVAKLQFLNRENWTLFGNSSEWFWGFMQFAIVAVTLALIYSQLHVSAAAHLLQSLTTLHARWTSESIVAQRKKICRAWLARKPVLTADTQAVFGFLDEVGFYVRQKWIPESVIWQTYSFYIERYWDMAEKEICTLQKDDDSAFENFARLAKRLRGINIRRNLPAGAKVTADLDKFAGGQLSELSESSAPPQAHPS